MLAAGAGTSADSALHKIRNMDELFWLELADLDTRDGLLFHNLEVHRILTVVFLPGLDGGQLHGQPSICVSQRRRTSDVDVGSVNSHVSLVCRYHLSSFWRCLYSDTAHLSFNLDTSIQGTDIWYVVLISQHSYSNVVASSLSTTIIPRSH